MQKSKFHYTIPYYLLAVKILCRDSHYTPQCWNETLMQTIEENPRVAFAGWYRSPTAQNEFECRIPVVNSDAYNDSAESVMLDAIAEIERLRPTTLAGLTQVSLKFDNSNIVAFEKLLPRHDEHL